MIALVAFSMAGCVANPGSEVTDGADPGTVAGNGILEGSVVDENFIPIQAAKVHLVGTDHEVETSWNGHFRFTNLKPGLYRIAVDAVGWTSATIEGRVQGDFATRLTIFVEPALDVSGYSTLQQLEGKFQCAEVRAADSDVVNCELGYYNTQFSADWAAILIEVDWAPSGVSSSTLGELTAEDLDAQLVYADLVSDRPARIVLLPDALHDGIGGEAVTPEKGVRSALDVGIKKEPARAASTVDAGATYDQDYSMFITTFYFQAPSDLSEYSALPDG
ncbi:MAG TPA: carboxypeptidase-like regulatory domain-containing protein [Candidatus Thermoplasmatota archaeon]